MEGEDRLRDVQYRKFEFYMEDIFKARPETGRLFTGHRSLGICFTRGANCTAPRSGKKLEIHVTTTQNPCFMTPIHPQSATA
jgi:hypothetical protein